MKRPAGTRREQSKAQTRRMILEAAYELFEENGYEQTTMRTLAARAGVGLGTIFKHFPDKSSLLLAAFTDDISQALEKGFATLPQAGLKTQLLHLVKFPLEFYAARPKLARMIVKEAFFVEGEAAKRMAAQEAASIPKTGPALVEAQERGELRRELDLKLAATAIFAEYFGTLFVSLRSGDLDVDRQLKLLGRLLDQVMAGIGPMEKDRLGP